MVIVKAEEVKVEEEDGCQEEECDDEEASIEVDLTVDLNRPKISSFHADQTGKV